MYRKERVAVTGLGLITSLGRDKEENWRKLVEGTSGVKEIDRFPTEGMRTRIAASVDFYPEDNKITSFERTRLILNDVVEEALEQAGVCKDGSELASSASVYLAIPGGEGDLKDRANYSQRALGNDCETDLQLKQAIHNLHRDGRGATRYAELQKKYGFLVPPAIVSTACASGATAIQLGADAIRRGSTKIAIAAGADSSVYPEGLIRFSLLSALSTKNDDPLYASRPFDRDRDGFVMGEGGAALVLEQEAAARERGASILGFVAGCGDATDNFHRTRSNPSGERIKLCIERALADARVKPADIGYVNAHGTSTPENDKMEALGLRLVFGSSISSVPVSSSKSMIGHTLAAAGVVEAAISLLALEHRTCPPSINIENFDDDLGINVIKNSNHNESMNFVLSNSFGFGGQNVSLVLERYRN
ncbi:beta-ketoacyl synthase N-terminal-like domain-containing protein [Sphingorhabdus sp. EL138]|uniref:beta-ketoacyl synthase N-terminal-like domain-containing protein n=1 Tax=Sphingorhabdus sp. EL138 TaxID=2073156 RepID=UPI000D69B139|nr:beta-ketoacyl synthase N-terminal-like domain-containing protein [Sphingorhabdus sp. EL138]